MASRPTFSFSSKPYTDFDVETHSGDSSNSSGDDKVILPTVPTNANHLLLVSLLEHVCSLYIRNPRKKDMLFKLLCKQLAEMNIMSPLSGLDELSAIKTQYKQSFAKLLHTCVTHLKLKGHLALPSHSRQPPKLLLEDSLLSWQQPKLDLSDYMTFHTSRYRDEFEEVAPLGKGAYGSVYKVKHKLDGRYYAVKKVAFQDNTPDLWNKTLREVKHLADLNHPSVIRYYTAWLEYDLPLINMSVVPQSSCDDFDLPALTYAATKDSNASIHSNGSSIIFEDSNPPASSKYRRMRSWEPSESDKSRSDLLDLKQTSLPIHPANSETFLLEHCHVVLHIQMELCKETLQDWLLDRNNTLTSSTEVYDSVNTEMNLFILREVLHGVEYLQKNDLLHRDLKPSNIFLNDASSSKNLIVKIGDFGLVRRTDKSNSSTCCPESPLTPGPGLLEEHMLDWDGLFLTSGVGTTIYASPEQLAGVDYGPKSDMYSIGLILFELYQPFCTGMERSKSLMNLRKEIFPPSFTEQWSMLNQIIKSLTDKNPENRPSALCMLNGPLFTTQDKTVEALHEELHNKDDELMKCKCRIRDLEALSVEKDLEIERLRLMLKPTVDEQGDDGR